MRRTPLNVAILLSGSGRTLQNLIDERAAGRLDIDIRLVIASRAGLGGVDRAAAAGLPHFVIDGKSFPDLNQFSERIFSLCGEARVDLICLAGWLNLLVIPPRFAGRIINVHPSLLPKFGGKGMYGHRVHQAVIDSGAAMSGCTVHYVDAKYDNGPIILQRACPVFPGDTADELAHRVFEEEKIAYPEAIRMIQNGNAEGAFHPR